MAQLFLPWLQPVMLPLPDAGCQPPDWLASGARFISLPRCTLLDGYPVGPLLILAS
jgi:hypothetical protein